MGLGWGPAADDPRLAETQVARRLDAYDAVAQRPDTFLDRYAVRYLALAEGAGPGAIAEGWTVLQDGPAWDIYGRPGGQTPPIQLRNGASR